MGAVKAKAKIMMQQSFALILLLSTYGAYAQFGCDNNTLPDGSSCPNDGHIDHTYADPEHCSRFFDCYNGCLNHMQCQLDYLYDTVHGWCDEPGRVTCGNRDPDGRPCKDCVGPGPDFDCEAAGGDGFYEYAKNCIKYIQCYGGVPQIHTCNPGLYYRQSNIQCDYGNDYYPEGICKPCFCQCHDGVQDEICCQP